MSKLNTSQVCPVKGCNAWMLWNESGTQLKCMACGYTKLVPKKKVGTI